MLIRLCGHYVDNPGRIDKLICIRGLPEDWFSRPSRFGGRELIKPWEPDIEANIPRECRHLCEPMEITQSFAPIEKGREYVVERLKISALRFEYMSEQGQTLWDRIERYLDQSVPRDQVVPKPILVAPDQKSGFAPHEVRRTNRGSLELRAVDQIPIVDLRKPAIASSTTVTASDTVTITVPANETVTVSAETRTPTALGHFVCTQCPKFFEKKQALRMHVIKGHAKKAVGV